jgi:hypothetical protein
MTTILARSQFFHLFPGGPALIATTLRQLSLETTPGVLRPKEVGALSLTRAGSM